jgi:hypothetical protein
MDKFEELTATAQILSAIIGRPETQEYVVVEMPVPDSVSQGLAVQGMRFLGLMGIVDGASRTALAEQLSDVAMVSLADVFVQQVVRVLSSRVAAQERAAAEAEAPPKDEWLAFMNTLTALPDDRIN